MEAYTLKISFCDCCGDFFARRDSLERHCKNRPPKCLDVSTGLLKPTVAKQRGSMKRYQKLYPNSLKRGSRQQSRLQEPETRI